MAMLMLFQNLSGSVGGVISNVIFSQSLIEKLPRYAPSVDVKAALWVGSGASAVRDLVADHEEELAGVLQAYSEGLRNIFYFLVGVSGVAVAASLGMGWVDVRTTTRPLKDTTQAELVGVA